MNNVLSGLERDIVVSYLCDGGVQFTLVPSQPAERIFSFVTGAGGVRVLPEGIILFTDSFVLPVDMAGAQVEVRFYFRKLGLSFCSRVTRTRTGALAVVIPKEILRLADTVPSGGTPFSCRIFLGESFSGDCLDCRQWRGFPLFVPQVWRLLPGFPAEAAEREMRALCGAEPVELPPGALNAMSRTGKALLVVSGSLPQTEPFPFDGCLVERDAAADSALGEALPSVPDGFYFVTGGNSSVTGRAYAMRGVVDPQHIAELLPLLGAADFLSSGAEALPLQDRASPLYVLYLGSAELLLATERGNFPLQPDVPYSVLLQVPMRSLRRAITLACSVDSLHERNGRTCACCRLSAVKAEDQRFLYESLNGRRYT